MEDQQFVADPKVIKVNLPTFTFRVPTVPTIIKKLPYLFFAKLGVLLKKLSPLSPSNLLKSWINLPRSKKRFTLITVLVLFLTMFALNKLRQKVASLSTLPPTKVSAIDVNREFEFALKDKKGQETETKLKYIVTKVELTPTIIIKGQKADAIPGRLFLIVSLKLENPTSTALSIKTRDFIRLLPQDTQDRLAPDIHNDPTEVQPISTKLTRVGFPVDARVNIFKLIIGEIDGEKQEVDIKF